MNMLIVRILGNIGGGEMNFEYVNALRDLDNTTAEYFLEEIFHHGDLKVRLEAAKVLLDLDPSKSTARKLRNILKIEPSS